jgi:xylulokinase
VTLLLGLDVGTTSVKAVVYQTDGITVAASSRPTPTHVPRPGWAFYRPDELWETVVATTRGALADVPSPERIASVAVASVAESGVLLDAGGAATTDSIAWFDTRTRPQARWLADRIGKDELFARSGLSLQPIFSLNKLLWHREHEPDAWARSERWLMIADYIAFRLCGQGATDLSLASRTLMLDLRQNHWHEETLAQADIDRELLAPLVSAGTPLGRVTSGAAALTGLPVTAVVAAGGHDHVCGAFAAGVTRPGQMLNSLGTAEAVFLPLQEPLVDPKAGSQGYTQGANVVGGGYYAFGSNYTSGASIEWLRELLGAADDPAEYGELIASAERIPAGSLGVLFLPHLRLANAPYDDPRSRGALIGLTMDTGRDVVARAIFEGLALESRSTLEPLLVYPQVTAPESVVAIGGGTRNPLLMRIKASVSNLSHQIVEAEEATALGAALLGGLGAGVYTEVYQRFYPAVAPLSQAISDMQATTTVLRDGG